MRRVTFALLTSLITVLVLLPPPAGAVAKPKAIVPTPVFRQERVVQSPDVRAMVVVATRESLSVHELRAEWQHVAICEVGGNWSMTGPAYSGIGFLNSTWSQYGGRRYAPLAGDASRDEQILIGMRVTGGWVPDQNGCSTTGW